MNYTVVSGTLVVLRVLVEEAAKRLDDVQQRLIRVCLLVRVAATHAWTILSLTALGRASPHASSALCVPLRSPVSQDMFTCWLAGDRVTDCMIPNRYIDVSTTLHLNAANSPSMAKRIL
jgi:hypothetical protein